MPNRSGGSGGGVGAGGSDLSSAATANIVGQGVGHVGDVLGAAGTMSPDGSVLYPSSSNLKYWASLFLRTDDELNSDFATTGGGGGGVSKSNSSSAAEGSVGTSDSLAAVGEMVEERIGWAVRAATSLFNGNNNNSSSDLLNAAATVGATTAETSSNLDFQMQSSTQMSSLNDEEEEDGAANVFKLTSSNESIDKLSPPAPLPAAASVAAPPAVIPSSINPWASSSRTATTTVASSTDLDVGMRMANITLEEPTSKRVITFPPSQPPPATSSSAAPHPLWDPLS